MEGAEAAPSLSSDFSVLSNQPETANSASTLATKMTFSDEELATAIKVIEILAKDSDLYQSKVARGVRKALGPIIQATQKRMFIGASSHEEYKTVRQGKACAAAKRNAERLRDQEYINKTRLRAARIAKLAELAKQGGTEEHPSLPLIPDGWADDDSPVVEGNARKRALLTDGSKLDTANSAADAQAAASEAGSELESDSHMSSSEAVAAASSSGANGVSGAEACIAGSAPAAMLAAAASNPPVSLSNQRACYICKRRFSTLHHFYDTLCPPCADLNWRKRNQMADLAGRVALVTGSRVKIGFQCVVRLLRCGATVIATSRFPVDAAARYAALPDYESWRDRLHLIGLDLRDMRAVESFCSMLNAQYRRLDAIVNNACQTVRRPPAYFAGLIAGETQPLQALPAPVQTLVQRDHEYRAGLARAAMQRAALLAAGPSHIVGAHASHSAASSSSVSGNITIDESGDNDDEAINDDTALNELGSLPSLGHDNMNSSASSSSSSSSSTGGAASHETNGSSSSSSNGGGGGAAAALSISSMGSLPAPSAQMSQMPVIAGDERHDTSLFPSGKVDVNAQQIDLRSRNSWTMKLEEVETGEMAEVFLINSMAPMVSQPATINAPLISSYIPGDDLNGVSSHTRFP